jgi:putative membrane protein
MAVKPADPHDGMSVLSDTGFLSKNIMDNRMEIQLSKLAQEKATDATIKKLAALMVTDHTDILHELERLPAAKKGAATGGQKELDMALPDLPQGKGFDLAWAGQMLTMHEAKIVELERFIGMTKDPALKAAVMKAIPKIKAHRDALAKIPGAKDKSGSSQTI